MLLFRMKNCLKIFVSWKNLIKKKLFLDSFWFLFKILKWENITDQKTNDWKIIQFHLIFDEFRCNQLPLTPLNYLKFKKMNSFFCV